MIYCIEADTLGFKIGKAQLGIPRQTLHDWIVRELVETDALAGGTLVVRLSSIAARMADPPRPGPRVTSGGPACT